MEPVVYSNSNVVLPNIACVSAVLQAVTATGQNAGICKLQIGSAFLYGAGFPLSCQPGGLTCPM